MLDPKLFKESIIETRKKEQEKKQTLLGTIRPHRGHTLFSVNKKTLEIKKAEFEKQDASFYFKKQNKKVVVEENCLYIPALNKKNLIKKLRKQFPDQIELIIEKNK